jgi:hypothetical protein
MTEFSNVNRGSLFKNDKKTEDRHPDMSGTINIDGTEFWISGWKKTSKAGTGFISLSVRPKADQASKPSVPAKKAKEDEWSDLDF